MSMLVVQHLPLL